MNIGSEPHNEPTIYNPFYLMRESYNDYHGNPAPRKFDRIGIPLDDVPEFINRSSKSWKLSSQRGTLKQFNNKVFNLRVVELLLIELLFLVSYCTWY